MCIWKAVEKLLSHTPFFDLKKIVFYDLADIN